MAAENGMVIYRYLVSADSDRVGKTAKSWQMKRRKTQERLGIAIYEKHNKE
jgi:hypothetical protein